MILNASRQYLEKYLFDLHCHPTESVNTEDVKDIGIKLMMDKLYDHSLTVNAIDTVVKVTKVTNLGTV